MHWNRKVRRNNPHNYRQHHQTVTTTTRAKAYFLFPNSNTYLLYITEFWVSSLSHSKHVFLFYFHFYSDYCVDVINAIRDAAFKPRQLKHYLMMHYTWLVYVKCYTLDRSFIMRMTKRDDVSHDNIMRSECNFMQFSCEKYNGFPMTILLDLR